MEAAYSGEAIPWDGILLAQLTDAYAYAVLLPFLVILARRAPFKPARAPLYLALAVGLAVIKEALVVTAADQFRPGVFSLGQILAEDLCSEVLNFCVLAAGVQLLVRRGGFRSASPRQAPSEAPWPRTLAVPDGSRTRQIAFDGVIWAEAEGNYVRLHTEAGRFLLRRTLGGLAAELGPPFVRVHRSAIVNGAEVDRVERNRSGPSVVVLRSGERIATGRAYAAQLQDLLSHLDLVEEAATGGDPDGLGGSGTGVLT